MNVHLIHRCDHRPPVPQTRPVYHQLRELKIPNQAPHHLRANRFPIEAVAGRKANWSVRRAEVVALRYVAYFPTRGEPLLETSGADPRSPLARVQPVDTDTPRVVPAD